VCTSVRLALIVIDLQVPIDLQFPTSKLQKETWRNLNLSLGQTTKDQGDYFVFDQVMPAGGQRQDL
jgi:hypothetical protein